MPDASQVTPEMYSRVFVGHAEGRIILEDLVARFYDRPSFVAGGVEGARATDRNEGRRAVVGFILGRIGQIHVGEEDAEG